MTTAQPGWYASPNHPGMTEYWDGTRWTGQLQPPTAPPMMTPYGAAPGYVTNAGTNGMAIASMVLGILWLYWVGSILALIFGYIALGQIKQRPQSGQGMAIAGIVLGWIGVAALVVVLIIVASAAGSTDY